MIVPKIKLANKIFSLISSILFKPTTQENTNMNMEINILRGWLANSSIYNSRELLVYLPFSMSKGWKYKIIIENITTVGIISTENIVDL